jgi:hypothetical protein
LLSVAFHALPGLTLTARVERLGSPAPAATAGKPAAAADAVAGPYWDGAKSAWSADAAASVPAPADKGLPELYRVEVADEQTKAWADGSYRVVLVNPSQPAGMRVVAPPVDVFLLNGSNSDPLPSVTVPFMGRTLQLIGGLFVDSLAIGAMNPGTPTAPPTPAPAAAAAPVARPKG